MEMPPLLAGTHRHGFQRGKWHYTTIAGDDHFPMAEGYISDGSAALVMVHYDDSRRLNASTGMWINRHARLAIHNDLYENK